MSSKQIVLSTQTAQTVIPYTVDEEIRDADTQVYYGFGLTAAANMANISKYKTLTLQISNALDQAINISLIGKGFHLSQRIGDQIYVASVAERNVTISLLQYQVRFLTIYAQAVGIPTSGNLTIVVWGTP